MRQVKKRTDNSIPAFTHIFMQMITFFLKDTSHLIICSFLSFRYHRKCRSRAIKAADNPPATGNVTNHASTIFLKSFQSTPCRDLNQPTNTIDPTLQWVVDMGIPMLEAKRTVNADPTSIQKPLKFRKQYQIRFQVKLWLCFHVNIGVNILYHALKKEMLNTVLFISTALKQV